jgi:hypothetical protein
MQIIEQPDSNKMKKNNQEQDQEGTDKKMPKDDRQAISAAHDQAEKDMEEDAEFTASSPNDDLDEGESARLGEDKTDVI